MMNLSIGIDVGDSDCFITGLTEAGELIFEGKILETNNKEKWRELLSDLSSRFEIQAAFEISPHYEWLFDLLMEYCFDVQVINTSIFVLINHSVKKTDKIDSIKIATALHRGDLPTVYIPAKAVRADRRLVSFVHKHSQSLSKVKGRIRSLLKPLQIKCPHSDVLGKRSREWISEEVLPKLEEQEKMFLEMLLAQGDLLFEQRAELDSKVSNRLAEYESAKYLRSIPGFGPLTSLAVASAVDDVSRFTEPGRLSSYFGVCGSIFQSGKFKKMGPMTKRGNAHVRWLLSQSLKHLHNKDPKARQRYKRLKRGKPTGVARGAQMRWLTEIIWRILTNKNVYRITSKPSAAS
jgi:transposase